MVKPTSSPVSLSFGTLPAGTVFMGGMGGGGEDWPKSDVGACRELDSGTSVAEWGRSCDPVVTPLPVVSGGVESGWLACSRGLGEAGGGIGRVADGASGMSPGCCCWAGRPPVKRRLNPRISSVLVFVPAAIREPSVFRGSVFLASNRFSTNGDALNRVTSNCRHSPLVSLQFRCPFSLDWCI